MMGSKKWQAFTFSLGLGLVLGALVIWILF